VPAKCHVAARSATLTVFGFAAFFFCLALTACRYSSALNKNDLSIYRLTNGQAGHEIVKTEKFLVPVGSVVHIKSLEFEPGASTLTASHKLIVQQIFNSLEEITENTPGDTNSARVAEFKKMKFEIRGYSDSSGNGALDVSLGESRAKAVLNFLTYLGTPSWRLTATGSQTPADHDTKRGTIEFIRTK
jgi:outer membrane protein OmpA-like peptidoglycan-associated protein